MKAILRIKHMFYCVFVCFYWRVHFPGLSAFYSMNIVGIFML